MAETIARFPFTVCFAYTPDETNHMADILLPDATDLESTQLIRLGKTKFMEQYWEHQGYVLRQPAVAPQGEARDFTWIATELARRTDLLERYNAAINRGIFGVPLQGRGRDYALATDQVHSVDAIWDADLPRRQPRPDRGREVHDLDWFKEHGLMTRPYARTGWYLYPTMQPQSLRFELPYQERLMRSGKELGDRLHDVGVDWWDAQLNEYQALPHGTTSPACGSKTWCAVASKPEDFPFWLITTKSMQYHAGGNAAIQLMDELAGNVRGHHGVMINAGVAAQRSTSRTATRSK